ncbi:hypothetical protein GTU79_06365 [Sodalis ligni]|uniref:hypothetical protein n=1 Tax=Sodalis ligni TaxID=2697027 RepID=UPI00193FB1E4|nr:hypothetical protein [Sodalis ligni]QWA12364.1 hypothetical protein GTU79_06365 [Sodalis ligni]
MNAEIIKDFLAGLGFQPNADESLDTLGFMITRNIASLGRAADATVLSMGRFIGRLANGLDSFSIPPLGGAFSANAATPATGAATSLTGLAGLTGSLAGLNRALQGPSVQAATMLAPTLSFAQDTGQSGTVKQSGLGSWEVVITNAGTSLSRLLSVTGASLPQPDTGSGTTDGLQAGKSRTGRPLAGYSRYQVLNSGRSKAPNAGNDNGMGSGVPAARNGISSPPGAEASGVNGTSVAPNNASDIAGHSAASSDKPAVVAHHQLTSAGDTVRAVAGLSAMGSYLINIVKGLVGTMGRPLPFGHNGNQNRGGSTKPASGSGDNISNANINPVSAVTSADVRQATAHKAFSSARQTGNQPDLVPQPAASGQGGGAFLQALLEGSGAKVRQLANQNKAGGAETLLNSDMSDDGGQTALYSSGTGGALGSLAKRFSVNPTALLNIAAPRLSASLMGGAGQWEPGRSPYANAPMGSAGAAAGAATLNQTTNITVNGAVSPSETAKTIADRQISVNATLTQLLSPKAR